jgi:hypothetical protein
MAGEPSLVGENFRGEIWLRGRDLNRCHPEAGEARRGTSRALSAHTSVEPRRSNAACARRDSGFMGGLPYDCEVPRRLCGSG